MHFYNMIKTLSQLHPIALFVDMDHVEIHILSVCPNEKQIEEKQRWLDQYAPFFPKEHRTILASTNYPKLSSKEIKAHFLKQVQTEDQIAVIDDDNAVLKYIHHLLPHVLLYQDSELVDE